MRIRPLLDEVSSTRSWLLWDPSSREAVLIDPVQEQVPRDAQLIEELGLSLVATLETHVHADHVTGAHGLRAMLGSKAMTPAKAGAKGADRCLEEGDEVRFGSCSLEVRETPGHTDHCVTYVASDRGAAFTGDALLIRGSGRTDFQSGDAEALFESVRDKILSLPPETVLYPAHDYRGRVWTTVAEERAHNPRLGDGVGRERFSRIMAELKLPHPKKMADAVPGNLAMGRSQAPWTSARRDSLGIAEVDVGWLRAHLDDVDVVDVRGADELEGPLGRLPQASHVPLADMEDAACRWDPTRPIALLCRSGKRSHRAAVTLTERGFEHVANVAGGMLAWTEAFGRGA